MLRDNLAAFLDSSMSNTGSTENDFPKFVDVMVPVHVSQKFTYRLPRSMSQIARVGSRVLVPLGRAINTGYIVALRSGLRMGTRLDKSQIKEVNEVLDLDPPLTAEVLEITRWVSDYYAAPWGEVMRAALPAGINTTVEQTVSITAEGRRELSNSTDELSVKQRALALLAGDGEFEINAFSLRMGSARVPKWLRELESDRLIERAYRTRKTATRAKRRLAVRLETTPAQSLDENRQPDSRMTPAQQRALDVLREHNGVMAIRNLVRGANVSQSAIKPLLKKGLVAEFEEELRRDPLANAKLPEADNLTLTQAQAEALNSINNPLNAKAFSSILLHGITGSGKTEVYIRAMHAAIEMNRGAMMLVPEIALTPILSRRLRAHFGDEIAIFHSSLSKGERFDEWSRLRSGEAHVVLGTRSAVFAPVSEPGWMIIDEEQG